MARMVVWLLLALGLAPSLRAHAGDARDVLTPIVASAIAEPVPVALADGRTHLAYELLIVNLSPLAVTLEAVQVLDAGRSGAVVTTLDGKALTAVLRKAGAPGSDPAAAAPDPTKRTLAGGQSAVLFLDVSFAPGADLPAKLAHRFALSVQAAEPGSPQGVEFTGVPLPVSSQRAVVLAPPLEGPRWAVWGGCCAAVTPHRGATLPIDGAIRAAERFAIDFVQLDASGRISNGNPLLLASYAYFGAPIHAAAAGVVVATRDGQPEQVPGELPADATIQSAGGNYAIIDIGAGRFTFYAHMQPGSLRVKQGDRVAEGDVIGQLGNSGNSDAPHLHFHVMDAPSPLVANGLPYVFRAFEGEGELTNPDALDAREPAAIDAAVLAGPHRDQLPRNQQLVTFPAAAR